jgi:hypothetical protein
VDCNRTAAPNVGGQFRGYTQERRRVARRTTVRDWKNLKFDAMSRAQRRLRIESKLANLAGLQ